MKRKIIILLTAIPMVASLVGACSSDTGTDVITTDSQGAGLILSTTIVTNGTRAVTTEQLQNAGSFLSGEKVDIWLEDADDNCTTYTGLPLTYESDGTNILASYSFKNIGTAEAPVIAEVENRPLWPKLMHRLNAYGLYPSGLADANAITDGGGGYPSYPFTVSADQTKPGSGAGNNDATRGYIGSDLMLGVPTNGNPQSQVTTSRELPMTFRHMLSKIVVHLVIPAGGEYTEDQLKGATVTILNTKPSTTFCVKNQTLTAATGSSTPIIARNTALQVTYDEDPTSATYGEAQSTVLYTGMEVAAIIVPQTVNAGTSFIRLDVGNNAFVYPLAATTNFQSGKVYTFNVDVDEANMVLTATIGNWGAGGALDSGTLYY